MKKAMGHNKCDRCNKEVGKVRRNDGWDLCCQCWFEVERTKPTLPYKPPEYPWWPVDIPPITPGWHKWEIT